MLEARPQRAWVQIPAQSPLPSGNSPLLHPFGEGTEKGNPLTAGPAGPWKPMAPFSPASPWERSQE